MLHRVLAVNVEWCTLLFVKGIMNLIKENHKLMKNSRFFNAHLSWIGSIAIVLIVMKPFDLKSFPGLATLDLLWNYCTILISLLLFMIVIFRRRLHLIEVPLILFCAIYCFVTLKDNPGQLLSALSESNRIVATFNLPLAFGSLNQALFASSFACKIALFLDTTSVYASQVIPIFQSNTYSLFSLDNYAIFNILPMIAIILIDSQITFHKIPMPTTIFIIYVFSAKVYTFAVTSLFAIGIFVILLSLSRCNRGEIVARLSGISIPLSIGSTIGVVVFHLQELFNDIFVHLGKGTTLSSRTIIWPHSIDAIKNRVFFGYGRLPEGGFQLATGFSPIWDPQASHTHNFYLELIFRTGAIGAMFYGVFYLGILGKLLKHRGLVSVRIALSCLAAYAVLMFTDSYIFAPAVYLLLGFSAYVNDKGFQD